MGSENSKKVKTILTGIKPTDMSHIGNYFGSIQPALELSKQSERSLLFIADYHALTALHNSSEMGEFSYRLAATLLACGLDTKKTIMYRQSDIPEIFELAWVLACMSPKGLMNRAHAYKARVQDNEKEGREDLDFGVNMGLYSYPVLMAADILMFDTDIVPVGEDQIQHVEIARDLAQKFNRTFGLAEGASKKAEPQEILKVPNYHLQMKTLVPGLDGRKMSKSYGNHIPIFLDEKALRKLVMKIKTDSLPPEAPKNPDDSLVFDIYKLFASVEEQAEMRKVYEKGIGWGHAKEEVFKQIMAKFGGPTQEYNRLMADKPYLDQVLAEGAARAREISIPVMRRVRTAMGLK